MLYTDHIKEKKEKKIQKKKKPEIETSSLN